MFGKNRGGLPSADTEDTMFHALRFLIHAEGAQRPWWFGGVMSPHTEREGEGARLLVFPMLAGKESIVGLAFFAAAAGASTPRGGREKACFRDIFDNTKVYMYYTPSKHPINHLSNPPLLSSQKRKKPPSPHRLPLPLI